jgi:SAM-dependent methyltransferase
VVLTTRRVRIAVCTFLVLYLELMLIRWLGSEIKLFSYFKNFVLMAAFLGFGLGCLRPAPRESWLKRLPYCLFVIVLICTMSESIGLSHLFFPDEGIVQWNGSLAAPRVREFIESRAAGFPIWMVYAAVTTTVLALVYAILALVAWCFVELGRVLAGAFEGEQPLAAYSADIVGSLAGSAAAVAASFLGTPPVVWVGVSSAAVLWLLPPGRRRVAGVVLAGAMVITGVHDVMSGNRYSPYYQVTVVPVEVVTPPGSAPIRSWSVFVNHSPFQVIYDFSPRAVEAYRRLLSGERLQEMNGALARHEFPFRLAGSLDRVAIVGAGTGDDVAAGLRLGARQIAAVDIDPTILALGAELHPERPYQSPAVSVVNDDARAFFQQASRDEPFDLIVFGTLDSHAALNAMTSLRLEYFVYTKESFERAAALLAPDGVLVVAFGTSWKTWVTERMVQTMTAALGPTVRILEINNEPGRLFFVGGPGASRPDLGAVIAQLDARDDTLRYGERRDIRISTDDWPYLYMNPERRPWILVSCVALNAIVALLVLTRLSGRTRARADRLNEWQMFFMGAGFLLVETKAITELSLAFGATWFVNALVFTSLLVGILLANVYVWKRPGFGSRRILLLLLASLAIKFVLGSSGVAADVLSARWLAPVVACGPAVLASIAFARMFSVSRQSAHALGWNVVGAMCGGALELLAIGIGNHALNLVALGLYGGALAFHTAIVRERQALPANSRVSV